MWGPQLKRARAYERVRISSTGSVSTAGKGVTPASRAVRIARSPHPTRHFRSPSPFTVSTSLRRSREREPATSVRVFSPRSASVLALNKPPSSMAFAAKNSTATSCTRRRGGCVRHSRRRREYRSATFFPTPRPASHSTRALRAHSMHVGPVGAFDDRPACEACLSSRAGAAGRASPRGVRASPSSPPPSVGSYRSPGDSVPVASLSSWEIGRARAAMRRADGRPLRLHSLGALAAADEPSRPPWEGAPRQGRARAGCAPPTPLARRVSRRSRGGASTPAPSLRSASGD